MTGWVVREPTPAAVSAAFKTGSRPSTEPWQWIVPQPEAPGSAPKSRSLNPWALGEPKPSISTPHQMCTGTAALWPNNATPRPAGSACRSSDHRLDRPGGRRRAKQPGYLSHRNATAAPLDRLAQSKTLLVGHCSERLPGAPLSV